MLKLRSLFCILIICLLVDTSYAVIRFGALAGFANASAANSEASLAEGPFGGSAFIDYSIDDRRSVGVEHLRSASLSPLSTACSFTGLFSKWYPYTPQPQYAAADKDLTISTITIRDLSPYVAVGLGFSQTNIPGKYKGDKPANTVGLYAALKGGFEYPVWRNWGARMEYGAAFSFAGTGTVSFPYMMVGFYTFF